MIVALLACNTDLLELAEHELTMEFSPIELRSPDVSFDFTDYYAPEFGPHLIRRWVCHAGLFPSESLAAAKLKTNRIEDRLGKPVTAESEGAHQLRTLIRRRVNIDPGILTLHNLILASCKDHAHRIPLGSGVYGEVTLLFRGGRWHPLEWTYPDYRTEACLNWLTACRKLLANQV